VNYIGRRPTLVGQYNRSSALALPGLKARFFKQKCCDILNRSSVPRMLQVFN
jgi:hypothetical protein